MIEIVKIGGYIIEEDGKMKSHTKEQLEQQRPIISALSTVEYCLEKCFSDKTHSIEDSVFDDCTYEELIGALLLARDELQGN